MVTIGDFPGATLSASAISALEHSSAYRIVSPIAWILIATLVTLLIGMTAISGVVLGWTF
jgi:hypothetical protein